MKTTSTAKKSSGGGIYRITCTVTGKSYIGATKGFKKRWSDHRRDLRLGSHHNEYLQSDWNLHGEDSFELHLLEVTVFPIPVEDWIALEQKYMDEYKALDRQFGYNISPAWGGCGTGRLSKEAIAQSMAKAQATREKRGAIKMPPEVIARRKAARLDRQRSGLSSYDYWMSNYPTPDRGLKRG